MVGGHATHSGIGFQDKVAAAIAVYALADEPVPFLGLPGGVTVSGLELETNAPIDDILTKTSAKGFCFINVKKSVGISNNPKSPLGSVVDQFVRQWIACQTSGGTRDWERPLNPEKDRFVLITGGTRARALVSAAPVILMRVADRHSIQPREDIATTASERKAYDALVGLVRFYWSRHTGNIPTETEIASLLGMTRIFLADPDKTDKAPVLALLRRVVLANPDDAENAWTSLVAECHRLSEHRSSTDRDTLRDTLRSAGFSLQHIPELEGDIHRLQAFTDETLKHLDHLAHLRIPTASGIQSFKINRQVTQVLIDCAQSASMLLISPPGAGKSGSLYWAAIQLREQGHPVVVVAVDRHPVERFEELIQDFKLSGSLFDVLKGWTTSKPGVFLIDALDATRGGPSDKVFQELIRRILAEVPGWRVIASVRVFDLRFGMVYRELFAGSPLNDEFRDSDFPKVRHLLVPRLSKDELEQVWSASPGMHEVYLRATEPLRDLLSNPFNLFLLANILSSGGLVEEFADILTQIELLDRYWSYRVVGSDHRETERETLLRFAAVDMIENRALFTGWQTVEQHGGESLHQLLSDGVLSPARARRDQVYSVSFSHHMLFDYTVARLVLKGGHAPDLVIRLTTSDDRALLMAPAAVIAFRMLWQDDSGTRATFWDKAFEVAEAKGAGAFCRMLPARVAAELTQRLEDFAPVTACLRRADCMQREAARFLVRHCLGALAAGIVSEQRTIGPTAAQWCRIVRELAEVAIVDVGWMLKPVIAQWVEKPERLTYDQKQDLGKAARALLVISSGTTYDEGALIIGIQAVARTLEAAPTESCETLRLLLNPDHVRTYGHIELFWMAQEFDHLVTHEPNGTELLADIYRAAYCSPLPSQDEQTSMSKSRILGLVSNKRQDFEMARHLLEERFPRFFETQPILATKTLLDAMECQFREKQYKETKVAEFLFGGIQAEYQEDWSYMWMHHGHNDEHSLIKGFIDGLGKLAEAKREHEIDQIIQVIVHQNRLACIWASLLKVGATHSEVLGRRLLPLLVTSPVLAGLDSRKPAGDLLTVLHPILSSGERRAVEEAILATDREETQRILLGCLKSENIVSEEAGQRRSRFEKEGPLPENREPFSITTRWGGGEDDWWLKDQGVDLLVPENARLNHTIKTVEAIKPPDGDDASRRASIKEHWDQVRCLLHDLIGIPDAPEALRMKGWHALAEAATRAAEACENADHLTSFSEVEAMVLGALQDSLWPLPKPDPEQEESFARSPSWSSPAPRIAGAAALMALARAKGEPNSICACQIKKLVIDPVPAVRDQILSRVNMLFYADPELMWQLCERGFGEERNAGILTFFLNAVGKIVQPRPEWITAKLLAVEKRAPGGEADSRNQFNEVFVSLTLHLWLIYDQAGAGEQVRTWIKDPIKHSSRVHAALNLLRDAFIQGDPVHPNPIDERIRSRAIEVFQTVVTATVPIFIDLAFRPSLDEAERKTAETAVHILNQTAREIYFGSGAYNTRRPEKKGDKQVAPTPEIRRRFLVEMRQILEALSDAAYPSITHHLLETLEALVPDDPVGVFRLVVRALTEGGRTGGYQYENLGADLFVQIIRRYLADFRSVLSQYDDCRQGLMRALDIFVEVGWPKARQLAYELPEMLR